MNEKEILEKAICYAVQSENEVWKREKCAWGKVRQAEKVGIFGAGKFFEDAYPYLENEIHASFLTDNNPAMWGKEKHGLCCISPEEMGKYNNLIVVIMVGDTQEIEKQLKNMQVEYVLLNELIRNMYTPYHDKEWFIKEKENMISALDLFEDELSRKIYVNAICCRIAPQYMWEEFRLLQTKEEYFDMPFWELSEKEGYIDVGAYTGDTIEEFAETVNGRFSYIYGYEMDDKIYEKLKENIEKTGRENIKAFHCGISDKTLRSGNNICMTAMDEIEYQGHVTLIKMDIEGQEQNAIKGGIQTIRREKPKMAVCVYHRLEDLWEIPGLIKNICSDYKIWLRHHSPVVWDSVCYAAIKQQRSHP